MALKHAELGLDFESTVEEWSRLYIIATLRRTGGNQLVAAARLNLHRNTLSRMIRRLGIEVPHQPNGWRRKKVIEFPNG